MSLGKTGKNLPKVLSVYSVRTLFSFKQKNETGDSYMYKEKKFLSPTYEPLPLVIASGEGCHLWDVEGKTYLDFVSGMGSLPLGHAHPKVLKALRNQACQLSLTSRYLYNTVLPDFSEFATRYFDYDIMIPMNTGVEAGETAIKIARRWGYLKKNVPKGCALIVFPENSFWGRTTAAISTSTNPVVFEHFGPFMPGFGLIPYNDVRCLETVLKHPNVVAFYMEPIQGEAGVIVPDKGYLEEVRRLCSENNVLWIADEIQTGLGRTGALVACDHECVKPDILLIGKGLAAGFMPMSAVFGSKVVMGLMTAGTHGSTFGGNPLACKIALTTLEVIKEQNLIKNACLMGTKFRKLLECSLPKDIVVDIRGKGLMNAIQVNPECITASEFVLKLKQEGLLAINTDECTIRLLPPLIIKETEIKQAANIIYTVVQRLRGCL